MAAEGVRFLQFYSGAVICAPARCAVMTGLHTGRCRIRGNHSDSNIQALKPEDVPDYGPYTTAGRSPR